MLKFDIGERILQECPTGSTHAIKGSFADLESEAQAAADLFCYNQATRTGAFFATVKHEPGYTDPHRVGENHTFLRRWTHLVFVPIFSIADPLPSIHKLFLFYDALSGEAEVYETDGKGNLDLKRQHSGWRTYWTQIIGGEFGKANLLFHDAAHGVGAFYALTKSGDIEFIEGWL
jgi:hypothetical protein